MLSAQLARLTIAEHDEHLGKAESRLDWTTYLPTTRGTIFDRKNRPLAVDRPSYDVAVHYEVITGAWATDLAARAARARIGRNAWSELGPDERAALIDAELPTWEAKVESIWSSLERIGGIEATALKKRLDEIRTEVEQRARKVWDRQRELERSRFGDNPEEPFKERPIREMEQAHVILPRVPDEVAFEFRRIAEHLHSDALQIDRDASSPIEVQDTTRREYLWQTVDVELTREWLPRDLRSDKKQTIRVFGVADHILGNMRDEVWATDLPFRVSPREVNLNGYMTGDSVGDSGVEEVYDRYLHGFRGVLTRHLDTGRVDRVEPVPGGDLTLTLDIALQARIQAILSNEFGLTRVQQFQLGWNNDGSPKHGPAGRALNAVAVVIEIDTGDILAMVSMPTMAMGRSMKPREQRIEQPFIHRAAETPYPPGSIVKPLVLAGAVTRGVHRLGDYIECTGHFYPNRKDIARCWIYREGYGWTTHTEKTGGPLGPVEAIARSCNIYFYTIARKLGMKRLSEWFREFGMGQVLDIGLYHQELVKVSEDVTEMRWRGEEAGSVPDPEKIEQLNRGGQLDSATIFMGIGQGPVAWTPVQAANAYAQLARSGVVRDATLILKGPPHERDRRSGDLHIDPATVTAALEGLRQAVAETHGTGHHINYRGGESEPIINAANVTVWAKTGTAQATAVIRDEEGLPKLDAKGRLQVEKADDHAWFVGLAGPKALGRPTYAIAVVVEHGGSGGRVSGPIANQIVVALQDEGYLPPPPPDAAPAKAKSSTDNEPEESDE